LRLTGAAAEKDDTRDDTYQLFAELTQGNEVLCRKDETLEKSTVKK
jgi:hypothetical protein